MTVRSNVSRMETLVNDVSMRASCIREYPLDPLRSLQNIEQQVEKDVAALAAERNHTLSFETPRRFAAAQSRWRALAIVCQASDQTRSIYAARWRDHRPRRASGSAGG